MATQHNTFIRKYGEMAIVITVTDWADFKELEAHSDKEHPDFLVGAMTSKTIYSNMLPQMIINTGEVQDITEKTRGMGIAGIMTGCQLWGYRKVNGLSYVSDMITPETPIG